jgi:hypothetical protein
MFLQRSTLCVSIAYLLAMATTSAINL